MGQRHPLQRVEFYPLDMLLHESSQAPAALSPGEQRQLVEKRSLSPWLLSPLLQLMSLDLTQVVSRDSGAQTDPGRPAATVETSLAVPMNLFRREAFRHHERHNLFPQERLGHTDHGAISNSAEASQDLFNLGG